MAVIVTGMDMPCNCEKCKVHSDCKISDEWDLFDWCDYERVDGCPLKSVEGLIAKVLEEVDGGTDDRFLFYGDVCRRIEKSIKEYCGLEESNA